MHLHTAMVPPRDVLDEVGIALQAACRHAETVAGPTVRQLPALLRRTRRARQSELADPQLDLVPVDDLSIRIAGFGFVTAADAVRLTAALKAAAAEIAPATVHFAGGAELELDGDRYVGVRIAGDLDALKDAARGITTGVEPLGFFVDRRKFRPLLAVATTNDTTTASYLRAVLDSLDAFSGREWELDHVKLMRLNYGTGPKAQEVERLPLHR